ncbi:MAG: acylneuraminate cytidylyltransferase family protein [Candidatus Omnitrophota bacterium]
MAKRRNNILVTIAARGGSKGVKDKNIRPLCGKPLIAYSIRQALDWGKAARIMCTTDSEAIAAVVRECGAEVPFMRPPELATDASGKLGALRHALKRAEEIYGEEYGAVVDLDVTAPIRKVSDIEGCVKLFFDKKPKTVFSVVPARKNPYFNMVEVNGDGYASVVKPPDKPFKRRQDAPLVYDMNTSIYVYDPGFLENPSSKSAITDRSCVFVMDELSAFDIDSEGDFLFIEFLVTKGLVSL